MDEPLRAPPSTADAPPTADSPPASPIQYRRPRPAGIWLALFANIVGLAAGLSWMLVARGARVHDSYAFLALLVAGTIVGLIAFLVSLGEVVLSPPIRRWGWLGISLSWTPFPLAILVAEYVMASRQIFLE